MWCHVWTTWQSMFIRLFSKCNFLHKFGVHHWPYDEYIELIEYRREIHRNLFYEIKPLDFITETKFFWSFRHA